MTENVEALKEKIQTLEKENKELKETVAWMHDLIWNLVRKNREESAKKK